MRIIPLLVLIAALSGFGRTPEASRVGPGDDGVPVGEAKPVAETQPTKQDKSKAKVKSVDDEIKALNLKHMNLGRAMGTFKPLQPKLRGWAGDGATEFDDVRKAGVRIAGTAKVIEWKKERRGAKDPATFDQLAGELEKAARRLAEAAGKKDAAEVKTAASEVSSACNDCHGKFKR